MPAASRRMTPLTFWAKAAATAALVALADRLFFWKAAGGAAIGAFALAWTVLTLWTHREVWRDRRASAAALAAAAFALLQFDHLSLMGWLLFWTALTSAVLLPRTGRFGDAWRWTQRLAWHALASLGGPLPEWRRLKKTGRTPKLGRAWRLLPVLVLPAAGGAVFLALFAAANPVISERLGSLRAPRFDVVGLARGLFWLAVLIAVWGAFRPRRRRKLIALPKAAGRKLPGVTVASVTLSLVVFNALFAVQNGLDALYLWSGAGLPRGVTLAEYAHRGAYPLIATALLAGLFVLVVLSPGSETSRRPSVRRLVVLWVMQNLFLVASTMLRTLDYIEAYSLTPLRIAALAWMGLVGLGLLLICWRMLRRKSASWLVNANTAAAGLVLVLASVVDLNGAAAAWNVRHAREVGGRGAALDLRYLSWACGSVGASGLVPLVELEARTPDGAFRDRITVTRREVHEALEARQKNWRTWTWRGARQLARANAVERRAGLRNRQVAPGGRECDGSLLPSPPRPVFAPPPEPRPLAPVTAPVTAPPLPPLPPADPLTAPTQP